MNITKALFYSLVIFGCIDYLQADCLDQLAITATKAKDKKWHAAELEKVVENQIAHDIAYIKDLEREKAHRRKGVLPAFSKAAINAELYGAKVEKRNHERMLAGLKKAAHNPKRQKKLMDKFTDITITKAHIKELEDQNNKFSSAKAFGNRGTLKFKKATCQALLCSYADR